ncbi:minor tail protein [Streptomyces phage Lilbooboo]|uniref:Minor tail protein n=1 Tax=Streptomyces phage Lilbooboo TaxID=2510571 RepID=A0A411B2Y2_9CAUD|nr:minor tail protein [Streptomyces phage Lilbooboo]QAX94713.1 minor tail protein [Streptomyces phage Lilbooboo]
MAQLSDWTCEFNGLVMGEPDSAISIVGVDGLLTLPEVRSSDLTLVQRNGLWPGRDYLNGRTVTLTLEVYGSTREEFTDALNALQAAFVAGVDESAFRFRFPGAAADQTAYVMARTRKRSAPLDLNFAYLTCNMVVELFSTSPYIIGDAPRTQTVRSLKREKVPSGFVPPATVPWQIEAQGTTPADPVTRFTQYGSVAARPLITITDAASPTLIDDVTGQFFSVDYDGTVVIDSAAQTITNAQGGDVSGFITVGSVWPEFGPGEHRLRLRSRDEYTSATASLTWSDRWV